MRVLLTEDDAMIAQGLQTALHQAGFVVDWTRDGLSASAALHTTPFDLVLLDLGLPRRDGVAVLRELRQRGNATPVIILTARDDVHSRIAGLDAGADDYIVKPFDLDEVLARMRSVLRRAAGRGDSCIQHGELRLDPVKHSVERSGIPVSLSAHEYAVLEALLQRPGAVLSRAQLEDRLYGWDEARAMVLDSFAALAPKFAETARTFLEQPWIDARPRNGKQSGAYSHPVTSDRHPYVFMNFMGERRDVLTLAHELGHAVHQTLAAPQGTLLADTPLTLAETASIFGEGLVFERLLAEATPIERKGLLAGKIEDGLNTVVRQIAFHRFESRYHDARKAGELSPDQIGELWLEIMGESLGPAIKLNPGYEYYWAYVSHFAHAPFYVYAYAFGDLLVRALMEKRRLDPISFTPLYESLLAAGGARTYVEALAPFGLDAREKSFWAAGCANLERLVDEFEELVG